jgi:phage head maturation protease
MTIIGPRGWNPGQIANRFVDAKPSSYSKAAHTVNCVISRGSPVTRFYGTEVLRIDQKSIDLSRMENGSQIPLLDSHQAGGINHALGRFLEVWIERAALMGTIVFNQTPNGQLAEGMVERGEIVGISAGYSVKEWEITDDETGKVLDPDSQQIRWDDDLTFTATKWVLHEGSLCSVPADSLSGIRSVGTNMRSNTAHDVRTRMEVRARISERNTAAGIFK